MGSSRGQESSGSEGVETAAGSDDIICTIPWTVPLISFHVDRRAYRPPAPIYGPLMCTNIGLLSLDWQLSITHDQAAKDFAVNVHHKTRGIPNLGITYSVYLQDKNGRKAKLNPALRKELVGSANKIPSSLNRFLLPGNMVQVAAFLRISRTKFHPANLLDILSALEAEKAENKAGELGRRLWALLTRGEVKQADVEIQCSDGVVPAHRVVLSAFAAPEFRDNLGVVKEGHRLVIAASDLSAAALKEVLHFVYLRRTSPTLYKANLAEVLEAARLFHQPRLLRLDVEKLLTLVLEPGNTIRLWRIAVAYGLPILTNMILSTTAAQPELRQELRDIRERLTAAARIEAPALTEAPNVSAPAEEARA